MIEEIDPNIVTNDDGDEVTEIDPPPQDEARIRKESQLHPKDQAGEELQTTRVKEWNFGMRKYSQDWQGGSLKKQEREKNKRIRYVTNKLRALTRNGRVRHTTVEVQWRSLSTNKLWTNDSSWNLNIRNRKTDTGRE